MSEYASIKALIDIHAQIQKTFEAAIQRQERYEVQPTGNVSENTHSIFDNQTKRWLKVDAKSAWPEQKAREAKDSLFSAEADKLFQHQPIKGSGAK
jgi:hypothetical protein